MKIETIKKTMLGVLVLLTVLIGCKKETTILDASPKLVCIQGPIDSTAHCFEIYEPVCGCNGVTYDNSCFAEADGISSYVNGPCGNNNCIQGPIDSMAICPAVAIPVCGCNDVTYGNACLAEADGITNYVNGACGTNGNDCVQGPVDSLAFCITSNYEPVCGCNSITYINPCTAEASGISSYTPGACGSNEPLCIMNMINDFNVTITCMTGVNVKKYFFQNEIVYVFNPGNCGACETMEVIDANCNHLGNLGGILGGNSINGVDFSTATFINLVWQK